MPFPFALEALKPSSRPAVSLGLWDYGDVELGAGSECPFSERVFTRYGHIAHVDGFSTVYSCSVFVLLGRLLRDVSQDSLPPFASDRID